MPKVPNLNELNIDQRGLATDGFSAGQATGTPAFRGSDLGNVVDQRGFAANPDFGRPMQALQISDAPDRLTQAMGQNIARFGETWQKIAIDQSDRADAARVEDAQNQLDRFAFEEKTGDNGWASRKGENAQKSLDGKTSLDEEFGERFRQVRDRIDESLGNARQRAAFAKYAEGKRYEQQQDILGHMREQFGVFEQETRKARVGAAADRIAAGDSTDIARGIETITAAVNEMAHEGGYGAEWAQQARKEAISQALSTAITTRINNGDLDGAQMLMTQYRDDLRGGHLAKATAEYQTAYNTRLGMEAADTAAQEGEVLFQANVPGDAYAVYNQGFNQEAFIKRVIGVESGGNPNAKAKRSSAFGLGQFTDGTWLDFGRLSPIGRMLKGGMTATQWLKKRSEYNTVVEGIKWKIGADSKALTNAGVPVNDTTMRLAYVFGPGGAIALYKAPPGMNAAEALRKGGVKNVDGPKGVVASNKEIFDKYPTTDKMVGWAAKSVGVKPDASLPTGKPRDRTWMGDNEAATYARQKLPNNPDAQRSFLDNYRLQRGYAQEQAKQQYDTAYEMAREQLAQNGGNLSALPAGLRNMLSGQDQRTLQSYAATIRNQDETQVKNENFGLLVEMNDERWLKSHSMADILRQLDEGNITNDQAMQLIQQQRRLAKEKADGGSTPVFRLNDERVYGEARFNDMVQRYTGINPYKSLNAKDKQRLDRIRYYAEQAGQKLLDAGGGKDFDAKAFDAELIAIMRDSYADRDSGKQAKLQDAPIGDLNYRTLYERTGGVQHEPPKLTPQLPKRKKNADGEDVDPYSFISF